MHLIIISLVLELLCFVVFNFFSGPEVTQKYDQILFYSRFYYYTQYSIEYSYAAHLDIII